MKEIQKLDGMWEFLPQQTVPQDISTSALPAQYGHTPIRVPGYWNTFPPEVGGHWGAYDHYDYPADWQDAQAGWYRCTFSPKAGDQGQSLRLCFDAVAGESHIWLNGNFLGKNVDSFLPFSFDITNQVNLDKKNELCILVLPPEQKDGLWLQPCGSWVGWFMRGIWQSVYITTRPEHHIADVFAKPSVRQNTLAAEVTIRNIAAPAEATISAVVVDGQEEVFNLGSTSVNLPQGETTTELKASWDNPRLWSPDDPHLYHLRTELRIDGKLIDKTETRFGFREFWIDGTSFKLNGQTIRLFGDSWHYMGVAQQNPAYARTWFEFAKSTGANAIRTHAMPYPPCYFDVADEMGMLIIDESAIYGSAGTLAFDEDRFWENCADQIRRIVLRDRNHPSVIFWSACNETCWKGGAAIYPKLVALGEEAKRIDTTRLVSYDENDCDLGGGAPIHAGHYGTPSHWQRSWKRDRPFVLHEFCSLYHGGPESVSQIGDEDVYSDYLARLKAAGQDAADMFLKIRSIGASSITPWNLNWYCLEPIPTEAVDEIDDSFTAGGPSVKRIGPRALTLNYGYLPNEPKWKPNPALAPLAQCYKRQRFFLQHRPWQGYAQQSIDLYPELWNDDNQNLQGTITLRLFDQSLLVDQVSQPFEIPGYSSQQPTITFSLPNEQAAKTLQAELTMTYGEETAHKETWPIHIHPKVTADPIRPASILGHVQDELLASHCLTKLNSIEEVTQVTSKQDSTLVLSRQQAPDTLQDWLNNEQTNTWLSDGGRIVMLPGGTADDPASLLAPLHKSSDHAYVRAEHDGLLRDLCNDHFKEWAPNHTVATSMFCRPTTGSAIVPLDIGDPAEGLAYTPLIIVPHRKGHVVVCGMDLIDQAATTPAAAILLNRLIHEPLQTIESDPASIAGTPNETTVEFLAALGAETDNNEFSPTAVICDGSSPDTLADSAITKKAIDSLLDNGGTLLINQITPETANAWSKLLGTNLRINEDRRYNLAKCERHRLLDGLNNFDLCWVNRDDKQPIANHTLDVDDSAYTTLIKTTPTQWEDYQTSAEQHKVAMMYRRLESFDHTRAALIEITRPNGRVIINQLLLDQARGMFADRAKRIMSHWLDSMGVSRTPATSLLTPRERNAVRADGYITDWLVLGPFTGGEGHPLDHPFIDEANIAPAEGSTTANATWTRIGSAFPQIDLNATMQDGNDRVAYAAVYVYAAQDRSVLLDAPDMIALKTGADGGTKPILNGQTLGRFDFVRELVLDSDLVENVPLKKGWNTLVIKLHNPSGQWQFAARFLTASGDPATELRVSTTPPTAADD